MSKRHLLRHFDFENGSSCLPLEREYWQALKILAYADGLNNWREFFYVQVLPGKPRDIPLASFLKRSIFTCP